MSEFTFFTVLKISISVIVYVLKSIMENSSTKSNMKKCTRINYSDKRKSVILVLSLLAITIAK